MTRYEIVCGAISILLGLVWLLYKAWWRFCARGKR